METTELKGAIEPLLNEFKTSIETSVNTAKNAAEETAKKAAEQVEELKGKVEDIRVKYDEFEKKNARTKLGGVEVKSFNDRLQEGILENTDNIQKFLRKEIKSFSFDMKAVGDMSLSGNYTGGSFFTNDSGRQGIIQNQARKLHVRDIPELPKGTMDGSQFPYLKENGAGEGAFATVAESTSSSNGLKPTVDMDLIEATAQAEYIAGVMKVSKKMLADVKGLTSFLQSRLLERLLIAEDAQLLNGDGTSPNISGITDTGNFTAASGAATIDVEQLVQAISQLEELEREANAIVLRPSDYWALALNKAAGSGEYDMPGIVTFQNGLLRIAGVPVYRTTAMTVDKFIVGDFRNGALLLQREAPTVEFFNQNEDDAKRNKILVRCEERIAFPIFGSDYFIYGDFGNVA